jgi:type I restriction enzyme S subunit
MNKPNKHTELPSGWEMIEFGNFIELRKSKYVPNVNETIKCLELEHFNQETGDINGCVDSNLQKSTKNVFKSGDVLFGKLRPYLKKYWKAEFDGVTSSEVWVFKSNIKLCDTNFLFRLVQSHRFIQVANVSSGSKMPRADWDFVSSFPFILPPLPEQRAIANILSTWDTAIQTTQALISQKEQEKKWLMQNLLTGKKRLKGFSGEWKEIHIRDVAKEVSIKNKSDKQLTVLSCTKYNGLVPSLEYFGRKIFADDVSTYKIVPKNHFAYATNHIEEGSIGYQERFEEALISPMYTVFKTNESVNDVFMYRLLKSHPLIYQYQNRMEGSIDRRGGLRWDAFSIIKIKLPKLEEQTAIAQVLQTADKEITLLKTKLEQQKLQKKGLMQVLLMGKVRVASV